MSSYFVRSRGKLAGPFDLTALQQMAKRGRLSRFDQLSVDKATWSSAGDVSGLFPGGGVRQANSAAAEVSGEHETFDIAGAPPRAAARHGPAVDFFYAQNGVAVGPVALSVLQMLATNGTLRANDQVWADGSEIATPARQVPMLASMFSGPRGSGGRAASNDLAYAAGDDEPLAESVRATQWMAKVVYFIVGGVTIAFGLLPIMVVNGHALWWWDGDAWMIAGAIYSLLAAIALIIITPLTGRLARPLTAFSLIAAPLVPAFIMSIVRALDVGGSSALGVIAIWGAIVMPILLACVNRLRPQLIDGGPSSMRVLQIVFGSLTTLAAVAGLVLLIVEASDAPARTNAAMTIAYVAMWMGLLSNLAAGVLGIVAGKPQFTPALTRSSTICLAVAGAIFVFGALVVVAEARNALSPVIGRNAAAVVYVLMRTLILFIAFIAWLSWSLRELLTWVYRHDAADA